MTEINENIIVRFLSGQATEEEAKEILEWKDRDEKNAKIFRETELAYNASEIVLNPEKFDVSGALSIVQSKLKRNMSISRLKKLSGYAATILITISLTWTVQHYLFTNTEQSGTAFQSVETPAGTKSLVTMEDGTRIWLNAKSKLTYPTHFANTKREVYLEGEGFFDVVPDKSRPFSVKTSRLIVNVLGTVFNLKSYPEEGVIKATLIRGKIALSNHHEKLLLDLSPNEQAIFLKREGFLNEDEAIAFNIPLSELNYRPEEKLIVKKNIDTDLATDWRYNKMIFRNESFESIAMKLERRYDAKIIFEDNEVKGYRFSGSFDEISIDQALKALQFTSDFNFTIKHNKISINK